MDNAAEVRKLYEAQPGGPAMLEYPGYRVRAAEMRAAVHQVSLEKCQLEELTARYTRAVEDSIVKARVQRLQAIQRALEVPTPPPI